MPNKIGLIVKCKLLYLNKMKSISVDKETSKVIWRRDCIHRTSTEPLGCFEQNWNGGNIVVDECICEGDFCNAEFPESTTSTTKSSTTSTTKSTTTRGGVYLLK